MTSPFNARQQKLLQAVRDRFRELKDPDRDIITNEEATWGKTTLKDYGTVPVIVFRPHAIRQKADIMRTAGLTDCITPERQKELDTIRQEHGYTTKKKSEDQTLADNFNKLWYDIAIKTKKGYTAIATLNHLFATGKDQVAEPCQILQQIIFEETDLTNREPLPPDNEPEQNQEQGSGGSYLDELRQIQ
jgi:hypothetical protein